MNFELTRFLMVKRIFYIWCLLSGVLVQSCGMARAAQERRYDFPDIFNIAYTPDTLHRCQGWFTDAGSWMGFTLPEKGAPVAGPCGPYSLDMYSRQWVAQSAVELLRIGGANARLDSTCYYPGELRLWLRSGKGNIEERLNFINPRTALLTFGNPNGRELQFGGRGWNAKVTLSSHSRSVIASLPDGEKVVITFPVGSRIALTNGNYRCTLRGARNGCIAISFLTEGEDALSVLPEIESTVDAPDPLLAASAARWEGYLNSVLRQDLNRDYDRIAVKAITTLISNKRVARGGLLHDGIIPSHAVGYFVGLWAWDSWRFSAGAAKFDPELAKNNIRAMFDYQQPDGMIIDCIYTNPKDNNARDSKPPLVCWAVDEIYKATSDKLFLAEMYPQLLSYYKWWFAKRDHDRNGICEYGSTDGTLEAAAWESGMDNAIRFDDVKMLKNDGYSDAWSMDQESVDLNCYLALECKLLRKFAKILGKEFDAPDNTARLADYFFDPEKGFFFDRKLGSGKLVAMPGCEAYTPLWTGIATPEQVAKMLPTLRDTGKFSTFIPFPTVAADNPKYNPRGYWRGPIWLDQTYFAIRGLRNYGYHEEADRYTEQVFKRLDGLIGDAPIHENYDTHTGARLKAPHFSWSASHLLLLYSDLTTH